MLIMPASDQPFRVMGIDPGTTTLGISILEWGLGEDPIRIAQAFTLKAPDIPRHWEGLYHTHGSRMARMCYLQEQLMNVLHVWRPHAIIAESPYLGRFPASFAALTELFLLIRQVVFQYDPSFPLHEVDPMSAKVSAGVIFKRKGRKTIHEKEDVRRALATHSGLRWEIDLTSLDEHSVDAVAVALYYIKNVV